MLVLLSISVVAVWLWSQINTQQEMHLTLCVNCLKWTMANGIFCCSVSSAKKTTHNFAHNNITNVPIIFWNDRGNLDNFMKWLVSAQISSLLLFGVTCYDAWKKQQFRFSNLWQNEGKMLLTTPASPKRKSSGKRFREKGKKKISFKVTKRLICFPSTRAQSHRTAKCICVYVFCAINNK